MKQKLKIALYSGTIPTTTFIENLIEGLTDKGIKVLLFGKQTKDVNYKNKSLTKICGLSKNKYRRLLQTFARSVKLILLYPKRFIKVYNRVNKYGKLSVEWNWWSRYVPVALYLPDVFHIQWAKDLDDWLFLKTEFDVKIVLSLLGSHINYSPIVDKNLAGSYKLNFTEVDAFHGVSRAILAEAEKYNLDSTKGKLIYTQIKPSIFEFYTNEQRLDIKTINILSVGRHHWVKGYSYAIDAMRKLKEKGVNFTYTIIANGKVPEDLLYKVKNYGLENQVIFLSGISQNQLFQKMKSYDLLLLPSLNEGIANVVIESMILGIPVISSDCGGMSEVISQNKTGWLINPRDSDAICQSILDFQKLPLTVRTEIVEKAHYSVKQQFNYDKSVNAFINLYKYVIS